MAPIYTGPFSEPERHALKIIRVVGKSSARQGCIVKTKGERGNPFEGGCAAENAAFRRGIAALACNFGMSGVQVCATVAKPGRQIKKRLEISVEKRAVTTRHPPSQRLGAPIS